ncbi:hypothetical protein C8Q73DRAFT_298522 [Cubamyces lactineus]|nr:hypothetical protein C8Q73DRAFT_298522 [Cubamyces lactineus]
MKAVPKVLPTFMQNIRQYRPLLLTCLYWHNLITTTPSFWSTLVDETGPDGVTSMYTHYIARRPAGPVCVVVPAGATEGMQTLCTDVNFGSRVKQLCYACEPDTCDATGATGDECNHLLYHSFPELETCNLALHYCPTDSGVYYPACRILPDSIRLRSLWLYDTNFLPITPFPALVELRLLEANLDPHFETLLWKCLSNCPALQVLELADTIVQETPAPLADLEPCPPEKVALSSLQTLTLTRTMDGPVLRPVVGLVQWFKHHAALPSSCNLYLAPLSYEDLDLFQEAFNISGTGDIATISSVSMKEPTLHSDRLRFLTLDLRTTSNVQVTLQICESIAFTPIVADTHIQRLAHWDISWVEETRESRAKLYTWLSTSPMLRTIRKLFLGVHAAWTLTQPSSILLALPCLNTLAISPPPIPAPILPKFVNRILDVLLPGPDGTLVCPTLTTLIVDYITVPHADIILRIGSTVIYVWDALYHLCRKITTIALARRSLGHPITRFYIFYLMPVVDNSPAWLSFSNPEDSKLLLNEYDATATLVRTHDDVAANKLHKKLWDGSWQ